MASSWFHDQGSTTWCFPMPSKIHHQLVKFVVTWMMAAYLSLLFSVISQWDFCSQRRLPQSVQGGIATLHSWDWAYSDFSHQLASMLLPPVVTPCWPNLNQLRSNSKFQILRALSWHRATDHTSGLLSSNLAQKPEELLQYVLRG